MAGFLFLFFVLWFGTAMSASFANFVNSPAGVCVLAAMLLLALAREVLDDVRYILTKILSSREDFSNKNHK